VLVPFPQAVDDHQTRNAEYLVERGAALMFAQDERLAANLARALRELAADPPRRLAMAEAARAIALPDAAEKVADIVLQEAA
jgi:UDP-N-acetylglucosamine--N-acetylmuramyl-(pentapeptide) pyrophosphoryl-undecaprenol N-acetylglucosamine transferase